VERFETFELGWYGRRAVLMAAAALTALALDLCSKAVAVAYGPSTLLFNVNDRSPFGLDEGLIVVLLACSLLVCVLPVRIVAVSAGVAFGGAVGNLTSRWWWASDGGSPDFIPFADGSTGNVADILVFVGALAMLLGALLWVAATALHRRRAGGES
jgi:hypothetical protein